MNAKKGEIEYPIYSTCFFISINFESCQSMKRKVPVFLGHSKATSIFHTSFRIFLAKDHVYTCIHYLSIQAVLGHSAIRCQEARSETGEAYLLTRFHILQ